MAIKEHLRKYPAIAVGLSVVVLAAAIVFSFRTVTSEDPANHRTNTYFTDDDGASFFPGESTKIEQLERQSKPAVVASVFSCDGSGGHRFVGYLVRHTASAMQAVDKALADERSAREKYAYNDPKVVRAQETLASARQAAEGTAEIKRPGPTNQWVRASTPAGQEIANNIKCPEGGGVPQMVLP